MVIIDVRVYRTDVGPNAEHRVGVIDFKITSRFPGWREARRLGSAIRFPLPRHYTHASRPW